MIKTVLLIPVAFSLCFTSIASANCEKPSKTVFSCVTGKGKLIEVCDSGKTIDYSFGNPDSKPDIVVRKPRKEASTTQWAGMGSMAYSVQIPNGSTTYSVFWGVTRGTDEKADPPIEAGVHVEVNKKHVASVMCNNRKPMVHDLEGINLKPTEE